MDLKSIRHHLHQHPEVSGKERETAGFINKCLREIGLDKIHHGFCENAILAEIKGGKPGKTVLFRCELDALPIKETNADLPYKSVNEGVGHKCGHDGHMTMLIGLAEKLYKYKLPQGKALLLFQPAEETGAGARGVLDSGFLDDFGIDLVFSLHNVPGFPLGSVVCKKGSFTPSVESMEADLLGKTSHAGMPDKGVNPALTLSGLIRFFRSLHQPDPHKKDYFLCTPIHLAMGEPAYGTSAGKAKIGYTFRAYDQKFFAERKKEIEKKTKEIARQTKGLKCKVMWKEGFEANTNEAGAYKRIKEAASQNQLVFIEKELPFSWGEDFGAFTQKFPGAMFGLGAGENQPELHNPDYDFPDALLDKGIAMFYTLAKNSLL